MTCCFYVEHYQNIWILMRAFGFQPLTDLMFLCVFVTCNFVTNRLRGQRCQNWAWITRAFHHQLQTFWLTSRLAGSRRQKVHLVFRLTCLCFPDMEKWSQNPPTINGWSLTMSENTHMWMFVDCCHRSSTLSRWSSHPGRTSLNHWTRNCSMM